MKAYWYVSNKAILELKSQNWKTKTSFRAKLTTAVSVLRKCGIRVSILILLLQSQAQSVFRQSDWLKTDSGRQESFRLFGLYKQGKKTLLISQR